MGSKVSKSRHRDSSPLSRARRQLAYQEPPRRPSAPKPPKEPPPLRILDWPIRDSKPSEDPWLPGWFGPRLPEWILWVPIEVSRPPELPEPRPTTRTAYIRCLENRAMKWHEWRYPQKREFDLRYGLDRAEEAEMVARLNDRAYAQRDLLGRDWDKYEAIPTESLRPQSPAVDGSVPRNLAFLRQKKPPPYWLFYPAGPLAYQLHGEVNPEEVWVRILQRRAEKWCRWHYPDRHEFKKRFERYEPDGYGGQADLQGAMATQPIVIGNDGAERITTTTGISPCREPSTIEEASMSSDCDKTTTNEEVGIPQSGEHS